MSTLQPNKLSSAQKKVQTLDGVEIPSEIKASEANYFHILFINSRPNATTLKFDHQVKHQIINRETYDRCKDTYKQLGYSNMVIFHNPIVHAESVAKAKAEAKAIADQELADQALAQAKADAKIKAEASLKAEGKIVFDAVEITTKNVVEFATEKGIDVSKGKNLSEKLEIVSAWIAEQTK